MNNYKELSFLISSLFVIYFFKDIITTLIILVILSSISGLLIKADFEKENDKEENYSNNGSRPDNRTSQYENKPQAQQNPNNYVKSPNFVYNR
jgi:hypothetical protein